MAWTKREGVLLLVGSGLLIAGGAWKLGARAPKSAPVASASAVASQSAASAPPASELTAATPARPFVYDCSGLGATAPACSGVPDAARALFEAAAWYRVSGAPCGQVISAERIPALGRALKGVLAISAQDLKPLERALLQNAALKLLSCTRAVPDAAGAGDLAKITRRLIGQLALSEQQMAELPPASTQLSSWLGDLASWDRGAGTTHLHELADASALAHQALRRGDDLANVALLVLSDEQGALHVTETAQRVLLRRTTPERVRVCIAELAPAAARCAESGALSPVAPEEPRAILAPSGAPPCAACHVNSALRGAPYGPAKGLGLLPTDSARIVAALSFIPKAAP
jgi:hypothetical protein